MTNCIKDGRTNKTQQLVKTIQPPVLKTGANRLDANNNGDRMSVLVKYDSDIRQFVENRN